MSYLPDSSDDESSESSYLKRGSSGARSGSCGGGNSRKESFWKTLVRSCFEPGSRNEGSDSGIPRQKDPFQGQFEDFDESSESNQNSYDSHSVEGDETASKEDFSVSSEADTSMRTKAEIKDDRGRFFR